MIIHIVSISVVRPVFVQPIFVQRVFVQCFSSNPIRYRLDEIRLDQNELDEKYVYQILVNWRIKIGICCHYMVSTNREINLRAGNQFELWKSGKFIKSRENRGGGGGIIWMHGFFFLIEHYLIWVNNMYKNHLFWGGRG